VARGRCWFVDSRGLVEKSRTDLAAHKRPYAHDHAAIAGLLAAVDALRPAALIGVSGQPQTFTRPVIEAMSAINARPIIFALSNPTSQSECTAEQAYHWSEGRAIFASGSPFAPVEYRGRTFVSGQSNNSYIFPGVGLGVIAAGATRVTDDMFLAAARTLADMVSEDDLAHGSTFPPLARIREISAAIATVVARLARDLGLATNSLPVDPAGYVRSLMYDPSEHAASLAAVADR
jgi:malate dehydrogenase (oxaloacetate-decarboxylating)(NADP+)